MSGKCKKQLISLDPPRVTWTPLVYLTESSPLYYIEGNNGDRLISAYCRKKGWKPTQDKTRKDYMLKWCAIKRGSNYVSFQEGKQLLYQIPNNWIFTTKLGLLKCLRDYERQLSNLWNPRVLKMADFYPETYRLDIPSERTSFFSRYEDSQTWICKPTGLNQGRGIFLLQNARQVNDLRCRLGLRKNDRNHVSEASIVQRYIPNPLLLGGRKFDIRCYMIIASTVPYVVFFRHGYVRLTCDRYDPKSTDLTTHLTNQYMQKRHPRFKELKEETIWSMEEFNSYVNEVYASKKGLPKHWVLNIFTQKMQQIMAHCFKSFKSQLTCRRGYFDLIGCDFLIDEDFQVWLLEMNCNPSLSTSCRVQKEVIPEVIKDTLDLTLEIFNKRTDELILPLKTKNQCVLLYNGQINQSTVTFDLFREPRSMKVQKEPLRNVEKHPRTVKSPGSKRAESVISRIQLETPAVSTVRTKENCPRIPPPDKKKPVPKSPAVVSGVRDMSNTPLQSSPAGRLSKIRTSTTLPKDTRKLPLRTASVERPSISGCKTPSIFKSSLSTTASTSAEVGPSKKISTALPDIKKMRNSSLQTASIEGPSTSGCKAPRALWRSNLSTPAPTAAEIRHSKKVSTVPPDVKNIMSSSSHTASTERPSTSGYNVPSIFKRSSLSASAPSSAEVTASVERLSISGCKAPNIFKRSMLSTPASTSSEIRPLKKISTVPPDIKKMMNSSLWIASTERPSTSGYKAPSIFKRSSLATPAPSSAEVSASVERPSTSGYKAPSISDSSSLSTPAPSAEVRPSKKI